MLCYATGFLGELWFCSIRRIDDGSEKSRKKKKQLFGDLRNRTRYWELKKEAEDRKRWKRQFINQTYLRQVHRYLIMIHVFVVCYATGLLEELWLCSIREESDSICPVRD